MVEKEIASSNVMTVMVIDDHATGRFIVTEIIKSIRIEASLTVIAFANPLEAIKYAQTHSVDLVLTDYRMPIIDGAETIRQLRLHCDNNVPIICATIIKNRDVRDRILAAGANEVITRPLKTTQCQVKWKILLHKRQQYLHDRNIAH